MFSILTDLVIALGNAFSEILPNQELTLNKKLGELKEWKEVTKEITNT